MTDREALDRLIEAVEAGNEEFIHCDEWIEAWNIASPEQQTDSMKSAGRCASVIAWKAHDGSLDAAKALHEAVLPRHYAQVHMWPMPEMARVDIGGGHTGRDDNPARAWLLAILKALREKADD